MFKSRRAKILASCFVILFAVSACVSSTAKSTATPEPLGSNSSQVATATQQPSASTQPPPTTQPISTPVTFGPDQNEFPKDYNPLTGQPVRNPSLLDLPALLISISNFPPIARPQAGLSFADYVFEIYITEGATRFLSAFYGDFPFPETPFKGDCEVRTEPFTQTETILGNRVWLDTNANGIQDYGEPGVGGVCVNLYDSTSKQIAQTTTDSNGYYGFNVQPGHYTVEFKLPSGMQFTQANVGNEDQDSDADPTTGRVEADVTSDDLLVDAGLVPPVGVTPTPDTSVKAAQDEVGPVRSGRLVYAYISSFFQDSCLIYAFASPEVLAKIPKCSMVTHEDAGGGSMLPITRMEAIAQDNGKTDPTFNYASNLYTDTPPAGGSPAKQINVFFALLNQSGWTYDPLYQSYLRYTDNADKATEGVLHADTDRLNGRQLHFENVIVIFADHDVVEPTNLDIHLEQGNKGPAYLFRDGQEYPMIWSTVSGDYEKKTGLRRPIQFLNKDGSPAALKPGHTWVIVVTPYTVVSDEGNGVWKVRFFAPAGAK
ncbi:MAG TPA: SdrD B-like domain-containing protein [Anaerolineales bacterium]|nr:SdrD B-like domain-containing protein [Anaerolineales bacterium]